MIYKGKIFNYRSILWNISRRCNYNCDYCSVRNNLVDTDVDYDRIIYYLNALGYGSNFIFLYGGEPTIHPEFRNILNKIKIRKGYYTNLWTDEFSDVKVDKVICSYHNRFDSFDSFSRKLEKLKSKFTVNIMLENDNHKEIHEYYSTLVKKYSKSRVSLRLVVKTNYYNFDYMQYEEDIDYNYSLNGHIIKFDGNVNKIFDTKKYICDIPRYITIVSDDKVYPPCKQVERDIAEIKSLNNILCTGYCSFPCILIGTRRKL